MNERSERLAHDLRPTEVCWISRAVSIKQQNMNAVNTARAQLTCHFEGNEPRNRDSTKDIRSLWLERQ